MTSAYQRELLGGYGYRRLRSISPNPQLLWLQREAPLGSTVSQRGAWA